MPTDSPREATESQAWRTLAESLAMKRRRLRLGLCYLLEPYGDWRVFGVPAEMREKMRLRLEGHYWMPASGAWLGPIGVKDVRIVFCLFMALEAEKANV